MFCVRLRATLLKTFKLGRCKRQRISFSGKKIYKSCLRKRENTWNFFLHKEAAQNLMLIICLVKFD